MALRGTFPVTFRCFCGQPQISILCVVFSPTFNLVLCFLTLGLHALTHQSLELDVSCSSQVDMTLVHVT